MTAPTDHMTIAEIIHDFATRQGDLTDRWAREDLAAILERRMVAERERADDERAAKKVAADAVDRFRDVLSECLGHDDENPGDDVLIAEAREHFGKSGPEPTRWRDFLTGALAQVDQIRADREAS